MAPTCPCCHCLVIPIEAHPDPELALLTDRYRCPACARVYAVWKPPEVRYWRWRSDDGRGVGQLGAGDWASNGEREVQVLAVKEYDGFYLLDLLDARTGAVERDTWLRDWP